MADPARDTALSELVARVRGLTAGVVIVLGLLAACTIGWAP